MKIKSIEISGATQNAFLNSCFKVTGVDVLSKKVFFGVADPSFTAGSELSVTISTGVPELEGACICKNRIFGFVGNKIYASVWGDGESFCEFGNKYAAYRYENLGCESFTACNAIGDQLVLFTDKDVYKLYGEGIQGLNLRMVSGHSGIESGFGEAQARVLGDIYYLYKNSIVRFSGSSGEVVCKLCDENIYYAKFYPYYHKIYIHYTSDGGDHLCVFDTEERVIHELCGFDTDKIKGVFEYCGNMCTVADGEMIALEGKKKSLPESFAPDSEFSSGVEFSSLHNGPNKFTPSRMSIRGSIKEGGKITAYCKLSCGEWSEVCTIEGAKEGLWEYPMPARLTDRLDVRLEGEGEYTVDNVYIFLA